MWWSILPKVILKCKVQRSFVSASFRGQKSRSPAMRLPFCWRRWQHTAGAVRAPPAGGPRAGIRKVDLMGTERFLRISWEDGSQSLYPFVWLRDNCQCPRCFLHSAKARKLPMENLDINTGVKKVILSNTRQVSVMWPDEHLSEFEADWLKKRCFSKQSRAEMQDDLCLSECENWGSDLQIPVLSYEDVLNCDESAYKWISTLKKVGIVLLDGAPVTEGELIMLGKRIGFMRLTFYGYTWQVQDKKDANNVAYTSGKLGLHTDYPALQGPPGVQFLHCLKQAKVGGESEVVDGFHVCNQLKEQDPEAFHILSSTLVDFTDTGVDYCDFALQSKHRIIELDHKGQILRINFNNATRDSVFDVPIEQVQPFYAALKQFVTLLNKPQNVFCYKMKPGHIVTFDNWRILHSRRGYQSDEDVSRHLEGSYLDWDVVLSRMRSLKRSLQARD
ncbi:LOW QUALITY PROTEIN: gamma-butyrobetaine dioxygenase [Rhinatrema bivittatum]|uniref:LOW QUALITY PROTEIN: gamma-butyrobetaine dioxygenase n=1 Tax=Rhinatrema bivittatum TaxID=194408 RepID=UPI0011279359|nr:LOW QUALITY PROTEIN: gamma-butyrobetaine dioxygenase [Rhinatrema bivittatum]